MQVNQAAHELFPIEAISERDAAVMKSHFEYCPWARSTTSRMNPTFRIQSFNSDEIVPVQVKMNGYEVGEGLKSSGCRFDAFMHVASNPHIITSSPEFHDMSPEQLLVPSSDSVNATTLCFGQVKAAIKDPSETRGR